MVRPYRVKEYAEQIAGISARVPDAAIGTDVIVGFPGETDRDFTDTMRAVEETVDYVHVFSYSDREGTASTRLDGKVDPRIIKQRSEALHQLGERLWASYLDRQIGRMLPAITLDDRTALTENYCQVRLADPLAANRACRVHVRERRGRQLISDAKV
jgi:threonylcarbamoyladenosine tRNA methylthiotransferase MtaB